MKYDTNDIKTLTTIRAAVLIPALQAGITGLIIGLLGGSLAMLAGASFWKWALLSGAASGLLAWWAALASWRDAVYQAKNEPGKKQVENVVRLEVLALDTPQPWGSWLNLAIDPEAAREALAMLAYGKDLSMGALTGRGNPLSRTEFVILRDALIDSGLAYWQNTRSHSQGCALSVGGRAVLRRYTDRLPAPPQSGNGGGLTLYTAD